MKKLDLKIKIDVEKLNDEDKKDTIMFVVNMIGMMIARAANQPDVNGKPTKTVGLEEMRRYTKVMDVLERHKKGIVDIDDDDLNYLQKKFSKVELTLNRDMAKVLTEISRNIDAGINYVEKLK